MRIAAAFEACLKGDYDGVASFVKQGGDVNMKYYDDQTLLHAASRSRRVDIAELLLKHGCDINMSSKYNGHTALHMACVRGHADIVSVLIKHGCDVRVRDNPGQTALHMASCNGSGSVLPDISDMENVLPEKVKLLAAIKNDDILEAKFFLMSRIRPTFTSETEKKLPYTLFRFSNNNISDTMFDSSRWEENPLFVASFLGKLKFVEMILDFKIIWVNFKDEYGRTALFYACQRGHLEAVRHLVKKGADVNHGDGDGNTPLHEAVHFRRVEIVRELVASGADYSRKNNDNLSALDLVRQRMETSDEGKLRIHREMLEIIDRQRELRATIETPSNVSVH